MLNKVTYIFLYNINIYILIFLILNIKSNKIIENRNYLSGTLNVS